MTAEQLVTSLKHVSRELGPGITLARFCSTVGVANQTVYVRFAGGWPELRAAAGLEPRTKPERRLTDAELLDPVIRFYERHRRLPRWDEIDRSFPASRATYARRYGDKKGIKRAVLAFMKAQVDRRNAPAADPG